MEELEVPSLDELRERKTRTFERRVALTTSVYAMVLAITSLGGNNATKEMLLAQQQASDQWAYYQAKSIKGHQTRSQRVQLELEMALGDRGPKLSEEARKRTETALAQSLEEEKKYQGEEVEIQKVAKEWEGERDMNRTKDAYFDFAEVLLQIAIVMASVSILADTPAIYHFSLGLAVTGGLLSMNGYLLLVRIPFLHGGH